jgi:hypothetical protein
VLMPKWLSVHQYTQCIPFGGEQHGDHLYSCGLEYLAMPSYAQ